MERIGGPLLVVAVPRWDVANDLSRPLIRVLCEGRIMGNHPTGRTMIDEGVVDKLWYRMRAAADRALEQRTASGSGTIDPNVRGDAYLFIVDRIVQWVDRIERNAEAERGRSVDRMLQDEIDELQRRMTASGHPESIARSATG
jgi:hypothetical protein